MIGNNSTTYLNELQCAKDIAGVTFKPEANRNHVPGVIQYDSSLTYRPTLPAADVGTLSALVNGHDYTAMSPYPGLKTAVSLQAWGYQLFVDSVSDPRIQRFITDLRHNPKTTPELGATCSDPQFKAHPSTFGNPLNAPA